MRGGWFGLVNIFMMVGEYFVGERRGEVRHGSWKWGMMNSGRGLRVDWVKRWELLKRWDGPGL
jgi:hypothetical protein